jgi:hypothetical protein
MAKGRAELSSWFAGLTGLAIGAFVVGMLTTISTFHWSMWVVTVWAAGVAVALIIWASRDLTGKHLLGHQTLSMVSGASASAIAAVTIAFTFAAGKDQQHMQQEQIKLLQSQIAATRQLEATVLELQASLKAVQSHVVTSPRAAASSTR